MSSVKSNSVYVSATRASPQRRRFVKSAVAIAGATSLPVIAQTNEVKVGFLLPLTGSFAESGQLIKLAVEMAIEEINAAGGIKSMKGAKLVPVYGNSTSVDEANTETNRMISRDKVSAIVGAYSSGATISSTVIAERNKIPYLVPNALADEITGRGLKYVFKTVPHFSQFATNAGEMVGQLSGGAVKTCALVRENNFFGNVVSREFNKYMSNYNIRILKDNVFPTNPTTFEDVILSLKRDAPDVVFASGEPSSITLLFKQLNELKYWPKMGWVGLGGGYTNPTTWANLGKLGDGVIVLNDWFPDIKLAGSKEVNERFKKRAAGKDMLGNSNTTYAGVYVLKAAIEKAASGDGTAIRDALSNLDLVSGPQSFMYERVKFDATGFMPRTTLVAAQVNGGQSRVVWPTAYQTTKATWPVTR
jgi:branched-chain amino acid transport system substrate-binding protein